MISTLPTKTPKMEEQKVHIKHAMFWVFKNNKTLQKELRKSLVFMAKKSLSTA